MNGIYLYHKDDIICIIEINGESTCKVIKMISGTQIGFCKVPDKEFLTPIYKYPPEEHEFFKIKEDDCYYVRIGELVFREYCKLRYFNSEVEDGC